MGEWSDSCRCASSPGADSIRPSHGRNAAATAHAILFGGGVALSVLVSIVLYELMTIVETALLARWARRRA
jgi:hypothetical protein